MKKKTRIIMYISIAIVISGVENALLPHMFIPGVKIGFTNIVTLVVLFEYGFKEALFVSVVRMLGISLFLGTLFTPMFLVGASGMIVSLIGLFIAQSEKSLSIFGISAIASVCHIIGQTMFVQIVYGVDTIYLIAPYLIYIAILTGLVNAIIAKRVVISVIKYNKR